MSEDAHEIEWPWKAHINRFYLDEVQQQYERSEATFRKEYYGEWLHNDAGPIKLSGIKFDKSIPKGHVRIEKVDFDLERFLRERRPFEPTLQDYLKEYYE